MLKMKQSQEMVSLEELTGSNIPSGVIKYVHKTEALKKIFVLENLWFYIWANFSTLLALTPN